MTKIRDFGRVRIGMNFDPEYADYRRERAVYLGIEGFGAVSLDLDDAKAARDYLSVLIEEIEGNFSADPVSQYPIGTVLKNRERGWHIIKYTRDSWISSAGSYWSGDRVRNRFDEFEEVEEVEPGSRDQD